MKPTLNDIKALIEQAKKLKQEVEQLKKKSFLTPVQSEAIKAGKTGTDIALYLLRLSYTNEEECENNFGIVDSYFTLTGSLNSGRFAQNLGDRHADDYGEKPERIEWYDPNKHTGLFARYDFDEKEFRRFLNQYTAKQRQLYWKKHIQPLIIQLDTDLTPWLPFMKAYIDTEGIQKAIKTAEPASLSDAIYEFKKIQKVVETEEKQESAETEQVKKQLNESQKSLPPGDYLDEVSKQINEFIVGCPANKNKFCEHIEKVIKRAEEYREYLRTEWQKAKEAKLTQYDEGKDEKKWLWWNAFSDDWEMGECVYFANDECLDVQFYIEGKPKRDPLCYLSSMIWGCVGQDYEGLELLDYQFVLLAIIHDAQNCQAGRERIYFNPLEKETLSDRLCQAVWHRLQGFHNSYEFKDVQDTINTAFRAVKAELDAETECGIEHAYEPPKNLDEIELIEQIAHQLKDLTSIECCPKSSIEFSKWKLKIEDIINVKSFWMVLDWLRYSSPPLDDGDIRKQAKEIWKLANAITPEEADNYKVFGPVDKVRLRASGLGDTLLRRAEIAKQRLKPEKPAETEPQAKNVFKKTGDFWTVRFQGKTHTIKNSTGMAYIACLLVKPNKPITALILANPKSDTKLMTQGKVVENDAVSSGSSKQQEIIDKDTLQSCQNRIIEINNELAEAEKNNDSAAQERLAKEKEQILNYIQSSCKPTGQNKSFPNNIEKARKAVTIAIRRALDNIKEYNAPLYQHLDNSIQRGIDFAYKPERNINWEL